MQRSSKQNRLLVCVASIAIIFVQPVFAVNGYILKKGKEYPICTEMLEIMNLSENAHSIAYRIWSKELTIPKRYKNFEMVEWKPLHANELSPYITPETMKTLELVKKRALTIDKDWDGKGDLTFEITQIDFDDDKKLETLLRYRLPTWKRWSCMLADTEPAQYRKYFNPRSTDGVAVGGTYQCVIFKYGDRIYHIEYFGASGLEIQKPKKVGGGVEPSLYMQPICDIHNPNWQKEEKGELK